MVLAGPGWVIFGAIKQVIGLFLAVYIIANVTGGAAVANQPVHQFLEIYRDIMPAPVALALAVILVVISQVKINVTNAYSGSLAWTNSFTRITKRYPGRLVFLAFNLAVALVLMEANMFSFLNTILGFYANLGMAWVVAVASDITFNKHVFKLSPKQAEFRRGMLYAVNPVGFGTLVVAGGLSVVCFFGGLGAALQPFSPLVAIVLALVLPPVIALATQGRWYLRRTDDGITLPMYDDFGNPSDVMLDCHVCGQRLRAPGHVRLRGARRVRVLALPQHRHAGGARAAGAAARRGLTAAPTPVARYTRASPAGASSRGTTGWTGRSVVASASALGAEDRRFESCRPDRLWCATAPERALRV